ncbi:MAG TPA: hypothetical protein VFF11_09340, partial [Candidatus Binatia bacterium]|nr:hypothetical protein [Candidatus Binatia bacterium]
PGMDTPTLQNIVALRESEGGGLDGSGVIRNLNQLQAAAANPQVLQQIARYCTVRGEIYEVHATARAGNSEREFVAVIFRGPRSVEVVGFHPK